MDDATKLARYLDLAAREAIRLKRYSLAQFLCQQLDTLDVEEGVIAPTSDDLLREMLPGIGLIE